MRKDKENLSRVSKVSLPEFDGDNIQEYMEILYSHQKQSEKQGHYQQADLAKKKLSKLQGQLNHHKREEMMMKHQNQKKEVQSAHLGQMNQFSKYWDEKMIEYQNEAEKLEEETLNKHEVQMEEFEEEIQRSIGHRQKQSAEIINLKKIEENLAKNEVYHEAHQVQRRIQELEKNQYEKWSMNRNMKITNLLNQLKVKQQNQINALRQRINQGFEQQKKSRKFQQDKLVQKYVNFMKDLEKHQKQELLKFDKASKMQCSMNFSRVTNTSRTLQSIQRN